MAVTQAHLDTLEIAIAKAQRRVKFPDGSEVEYRSVEEMREALALFKAQLGTDPVTSFVVRTTKGL